MSFNRTTLLIFTPILILVGILGFVIPPGQGLTSGAAPYNIFHIFFGVIGLGALITRHEIAAAAFNLGFGLIDLYQFLASYANLFPERHFQWTGTDDILHIVIGLILALVGLYGFLTNRPVPVRYI